MNKALALRPAVSYPVSLLLQEMAARGNVWAPTPASVLPSEKRVGVWDWELRRSEDRVITPGAESRRKVLPRCKGLGRILTWGGAEGGHLWWREAREVQGMFRNGDRACVCTCVYTCMCLVCPWYCICVHIWAYQPMCEHLCVSYIYKFVCIFTFQCVCGSMFICDIYCMSM